MDYPDTDKIVQERQRLAARLREAAQEIISAADLLAVDPAVPDGLPVTPQARYLLLARDLADAAERLGAIAGRLPAVVAPAAKNAAIEGLLALAKGRA